MCAQKTVLITGITGQDGSYLADSISLIRAFREIQPDDRVFTAGE